MMPELELELDRIATGGAALGRDADGKVVFVTGALPGERVEASVTADHKSRIEAELTRVHRAAVGRRPPPCPHVTAGCGGCDWQHAEPDLQRELRRAIVVDCLTRLAGFDDVDVRLGPPLDPTGYRTTVRLAARDGVVGFRSARSHRLVPIDSCLVAHPRIDDVIATGRFGTATEVTLRVGARTGDRLAVVTPTASGVEVPADVTVVGADELRAGTEAAHHEAIGGRRLRISARSFFQCRPDGAEALVDVVANALRRPDGADRVGSTVTLLDAYCGVGLFGIGLATAGRSAVENGRPDGHGDGDDERRRFDRVVGVESNRSAAADAAHNYAAHLTPCGVDATVVAVRMERWRPEPVSAVVADPSRAGLGKVVSARLAATGAPVIALVSCDPASLARDAALLEGHGYRLDGVTVLDLFGNTSHVETVSRFVRR